jgi:uncharacterized membrane protein YdjX (TVP38/TMEM64 family)
MYEIWLMLNIVWEIALGIWPLLLAGAVLWLALLGTAWRQDGRHWRTSTWPALGIGAAVAVVAALVLPGSIGSTLSDMGYWVDWGMLLALAAAAGGVAVAFAWPLLSWRHGRARA